MDGTKVADLAFVIKSATPVNVDLSRAAHPSEIIQQTDPQQPISDDSTPIVIIQPNHADLFDESYTKVFPNAHRPLALDSMHRPAVK